jgi:hypothetical protein
MWKLFFKGKIGIMKKSSQKFVSPLYISIDIRDLSNWLEVFFLKAQVVRGLNSIFFD